MTRASLRIARTHRRLTVGMALSALVAFAAGAGLPPIVSAVTGALLALALFWQPTRETGRQIERAVLLATAVLVVWALYQVFIVTDDVVAPVVALLLLLLTGEALRSLDAHNDIRLYTLSFALLIAATAYLPGVVFAAAFIVFVLLTSLALMTGHLRREAERHEAPPRGLDRTLIRSTIALSLVTLGMGALVFLAFPRLPRNIFGRGITTPGISMAGFGEQVSIGEYGSRIYPNPETVLRVEFPVGDSTRRPSSAAVGSMYWRGRSYDEFDGVRWSRNARRMPRAWAPRDWYAEWETRASRPQFEQRIYGGALDARVLFGLHPVADIIPRSTFRPIMDAVGDFSYVGDESPVYGLRSGYEAPPPELLRAAVPGPSVSAPVVARSLEQRLNQVVTRFYLQLPPLTGRVRALADSLTAGRSTQYDRVIAVQTWLESNFDYTLELPASAREASLDHFLFERRAGHCEYFSTALAVLLRAVGIPARNVNGFLGGQWNDFGQYLAVTQNDAHSWVEVWFPGVGWVPFDATPAGGTAGLAAGNDLLAPLRNLLNGMQHRWGKWVIDYNLDRQVELFSRVGDLFSRDRAARPEEQRVERTTPSWRYFAFAAATIIVLLLAFRILSRRGPKLRPESKMYLALRRAFARAGWPDEMLTELAFPRRPRDPAREVSLAPLQWLAALRLAGAPATDATEHVTRRYLAARYGRREMSIDEMRMLKAMIARIRNELRGRPSPAASQAAPSSRN